MFERQRAWVTVDEYLELEATADTKSEYFDGEIFAMTGATAEHNLIVTNLIRELGSQLEERPCLVYASGQRLKISGTGLYTYPDVTVACGEPKYEEPDRRALLNPTLIVEVLSESTEAYDRGDKFAHYRRLASICDYVLVASDQPRIERFSRQEGREEWLLAECNDPAGSLELPSFGGALSLPHVYSKVEFVERQPGKRRGPG
jgi:Uma2 family endonuclease